MIRKETCYRKKFVGSRYIGPYKLEQSEMQPMLPTKIQTVLARRPLGLVFDIDGTLSPIAPTPDKAKLYPGVAGLLRQLRAYAHVAIMTGRSIDDGARMVNVEGLTYIGSHGLEWSDGLPSSHPVRVVPEALAYVTPGEKLLDLAEQQLSTLPGILVERKRVGGAIHYRLSPDPKQARERILGLLEEPARQAHMLLQEGKKVVEIKSPLAINKGQALLWYMLRFGLQGIIFAGDDRTDLDAVVKVARLRQEGRVALAIVVRHHDTLPELIAQADIVVQEVDGMIHLLREMVQTLQRNSGTA
jgi:trehalose 6-phosphate phosphatase